MTNSAAVSCDLCVPTSDVPGIGMDRPRSAYTGTPQGPDIRDAPSEAPMALTLLHQPTIPLPTTSLVGRDTELARVLALLADPAVRLVTLTGPGGVGKTRLALQIAHDIDPDIAGEVHFVALASARDASQALPAIAREIGLSQIAALPLENAIAAAIGDRRMLLILDNAEQVAEHLTPLATLLASCRNLTILVTSRVMLRLSAEVVSPIDPLPTTSDSASTIAPATMLFIERARAVRPDLPLTPPDIAAIDEICRDLDGLPLAIELAAARARFLSPTALRARLSERLQVLTGGPRDAPERHQTLRATLEWSHDLLGPAERTLFRRLAIFENGAPYDAVAPVCGDDLDADVDETLAALADHSLVRIFDRPETGPRVRMLHTIREFAHDRLVESGELEATRQRHADWFASLVLSTPRSAWRTGTPELRASTLRFQPDAENFGAMLPALLDAGREADAVCAVGGLVPFWMELGRLRDARSWTRHVASLAEAAPVEAQGHFHYMAAVASFTDNELEQARMHGERALAIAGSTGDLRLTANVQNLLGQIAWRLGDPAEGERLQRASIATSLEIPGGQGTALFTSLLGLMMAERGSLSEAEALLEQSTPAIERERPDAMHLAQGAMAYLRLRQGDAERAAEALGRSLEFHSNLPYHQPTSLVERLVHASWLATVLRLDREGARLFGAAEGLGARIGLAVDSACEVGAAEARAALLGRLPAEDHAAEVAAGKGLAIPDAIALAREVVRHRQEPDHEEPDPERDTLGLTGRQLDVLRLLAEGKSNPAIAEALFISERTVTTHLTRIYDRLDVATRTEAIARATQLGLVGAPAAP
jgi:non-specific serine/threonine protein kinase